MSIQDNLTETIIKWAATRPDEVVFDPKTGFYSFEIVSDAYNKGKEKMMEELKAQMRNKYYDNAKMGSEALRKIMDSLSERGYLLNKLFVNNSTKGTIIILSIPEEIYATEEFIDFAYAEALTIQAAQHNLNHNLKISFMADSTNLNLDLLKSDGFGFAFDLNKVQPIY